MENQKEIYEALVSGKILTNKNDNTLIIKLDEQGHLITKRKSPGWKRENWYFEKPENWKIYEEPKKPVTYEDAIEAKKVRVYFPKVEGISHVYTKNLFWTFNELLVFDLAERKNYKMEIIE